VPTRFTNARANFNFFLHDIDTLIRAHDASTGKKQGRAKPELDVFKRSALILLVTAWESFIEDTLKSEFKIRLANAKSPSEIQGTFNAVADAWLKEHHKNPTDLQEWAGDGWRKMIDSLSHKGPD
jgi:RiboL-PSP-HEPN